MRAGDPEVSAAVASAGDRLREVRRRLGMSLKDVSTSTGISTSTLSRLESGARKVTIELLMPLIQHYRVTLDDIVVPLTQADPRVAEKPFFRGSVEFVPLRPPTQQPQIYRLRIPSSSQRQRALHVHQGHEWLFVIRGRLRLIVGNQDLILEPGAAADFDTRTPHAFLSAGDGDVEVLSLFDAHGQQAHVDVADHPD